MSQVLRIKESVVFNVENPQEVYFCKQHNNVACDVKRNSKSEGMFCMEEGEFLTYDSVYVGMAWIFTWADLGFDESPFTE